MPSYLNTQSAISINPADTKNNSTSVSQLIDILGIDIASKDSSDNPINTRRSYEVWVSGSTSEDNSTSLVTSSIYQTVYDQDFTYQTSNELLDITVGLCEESDSVTNTLLKTDSSGKMIFPDSTIMMREKINIYKQYAQYLLGDSSSYFYTPYDSSIESNRINSAIFINLKRLFTRDAIKKETFVLRLYKTESSLSNNIDKEGSNELILSDSGAKANHRISLYGGSISSLKDSENNDVGLIYYDRGIVVLNAEKIFDFETFDESNVLSISTNPSEGTVCKIIDLGTTQASDWTSKGASANPTVNEVFVCTDVDSSTFGDGTFVVGTNLISGEIDSVLDGTGRKSFNNNMKNLFISGSVDDVIDHICESRFVRDNETSIVFQNKTIINSTILFCRAAPSQLNYSSNPTYLKSDGSIRVVDDENSEPFTYVTTVGLYNGSDELVAVAKTSRPIEKNPETDLSIRIRLDF